MISIARMHVYDLRRIYTKKSQLADCEVMSMSVDMAGVGLQDI